VGTVPVVSDECAPTALALVVRLLAVARAQRAGDEDAARFEARLLAEADAVLPPSALQRRQMIAAEREPAEPGAGRSGDSAAEWERAGRMAARVTVALHKPAVAHTATRAREHRPAATRRAGASSSTSSADPPDDPDDEDPPAERGDSAGERADACPGCGELYGARYDPDKVCWPCWERRHGGDGSTP
jgi:hypothetical protein